MTQVILAGVLGLLFALGTFLILRRDVVRIVWGITIISQAANVYLVTMGGLTGQSPVLGHGGEHPVACSVPDAGAECITDPLVQALVLTAIVISFGTTAFALALSYRAYQENETIDVTEWAR